MEALAFPQLYRFGLNRTVPPPVVRKCTLVPQQRACVCVCMCVLERQHKRVRASACVRVGVCVWVRSEGRCNCIQVRKQQAGEDCWRVARGVHGQTEQGEVGGAQQ
jgi:hypothetical protein